MTPARRPGPARRLSRRPRRPRVRPKGRTVARRAPRASGPRRRGPAAVRPPPAPAPLPPALPAPPEVPLLPPPAIQLPPPAAPPSPEPTATDRFIAWAFLLGGFAGFALLLGATWALEAEVAPADTWTRQGLAAGTTTAVVLQTLSVLGGIGHLTHRPWARRLLRLVSVAGLVLAAAAAVVLAAGPLTTGDLLLPAEVALVAVVADVVLVAFLGWAALRLGPATTPPQAREAPPAWAAPPT